MAAPKKISNFTAPAMYSCIGLALLYFILIFLLPANKQVTANHNLTSAEYHTLVFLIVLPSVAVWFVAFYGYAKLREYAVSLKAAPESMGFERLARGVMWLAWSLPVTAIVSITVNSIANSSSGFHPAAIIITNYITLLFPLVAFSLIGMASRNLLSHTKLSLSSTTTRIIMVLFLIAGVLYCYLIFRNFDSSSLGSTDNPYFLPIWLMLITVIVPFLYAWFIGILAAYEIVSYSRQVRGVLYRQALHLMVGGLVAVIIASIALQYMASIQPSTGHLTISFRLILNVVFRAIGGVGFILMALGATRMKRIEDI